MRNIVPTVPSYHRHSAARFPCSIPGGMTSHPMADMGLLPSARLLLRVKILLSDAIAAL
jgi:hypothetical protein